MPVQSTELARDDSKPTRTGRGRQTMLWSREDKRAKAWESRREIEMIRRVEKSQSRWCHVERSGAFACSRRCL
jgi:hypothetical protein